MPKLYIHFGTAKTGTSSIQRWMKLNYEDLKAKGLLYPALEHEGDQSPNFNDAHHILAFHWGQGWTRYRADTTAKAWESLFAQASLWDGDILISSETFALVAASHSEELFELVAKGLPRYTIVPIVYLREHASLIRSDAFETLRGQPAGASILRHFMSPPPHLRELTQYRKIVENITGHRLVTEAHVRPFDKAQFEGGSLLADFKHIVGLSDWSGAIHEPSVNSYADTHAMACMLEAIGGVGFARPRHIKEIAYKKARQLPDTSGPFRWPAPVLDYFSEKFASDTEFLDKYYGQKFFITHEQRAPGFHTPGEVEDRIAALLFEAVTGRRPTSEHFLSVLRELSVSDFLSNTTA